MSTETALQVAFAAAAVAAAGALAAAALGRAGRSALSGLAAVAVLASVVGWVVFALGPTRSLGLSAGGLTVCALAVGAAIAVQEAVARSRRIDAEVDRAEVRLLAVIEREATERAAELERMLARARAESLSLLADEERRIGEERRAFVIDREERASGELTEALAIAQRRVERRLAEWSADLEKSQTAVTATLAQLAERQGKLVAEAEARLASELSRLESDTDEKRAGLARLRDEVGKATDDVLAASNAELEAHGAERRRALHELSERLRRRERALAEQIVREEADARQRVQSTSADVERRHVERLERVVERTTASYSEAAAKEFAEAIKGAREDAARRLSRELDRAVQAFAREAEGVLAERLTSVGTEGVQRLERRLTQATSGFDRQRDELVAALEVRVSEAEADLRRRLDGLSSDAEAEREVIEARLHELARRIEETVGHAQTRLAAIESLRTS
jgi:hypothetical protein